MSMNFRLLIRNLRMIKEQDEKLIETLMIANPGLDFEDAKRFIERETHKLNILGLIHPYSGRTMQMILDNANTSIRNYYAVRE